MRASRSTRSCARPLKSRSRGRAQAPAAAGREPDDAGGSAGRPCPRCAARRCPPGARPGARARRSPARVRPRTARRAPGLADELLARRQRDRADQVDPVEQRSAEPPVVAGCVGVAQRQPPRAGPQGHSLHAATSIAARGERDVRLAADDLDLARSRAARAAPRSRARVELRRTRRGTARRGARASPRPGRGRAPPPTSPEGEIVWCGARKGRSDASRPLPMPGDAVDARDLDRLVEASAAAGCPAAAARASSCRRPAGRPSAGCGRRRPRSRARAWRRPGRARRRGRAAAARAAGAAGGRPRGLGPAVEDLDELAQVSAPTTSSPSTSAASAAFATARRAARSPRARAPSAIASAPWIGRSPPLSASSPQTAEVASASGGIWPVAARSATAIARSKPGPALRTCAGARLTVSRWSGNSSSELSSAARTRSRASRTAASGRPTIENAGSPRRRSTSTVTSRLSMPSRANVATFASTPPS